MPARAFLGNQAVGGFLPFNPNSVAIPYRQQQASRDTMGGRVVQLLAVSVDDMTVDGVAGSRRKLLDISRLVARVMRWQIDTQLPVHFRVATRKWDFLVYVRAMPAIRWDLKTVDYPYQLTLAVQEDLGVYTPSVLHGQLARLRKGIGYSDDFSGGDAAGSQQIVSYLMQAAGANLEGANDFQGTGDGAIGNAPFDGATIRRQIHSAWKFVFGERQADAAVCVAEHESGFNPRATNSYIGVDGKRHVVRGLFQISDVHRAAVWYPLNDDELFDPDVNTRAAMRLFQAVGEKWRPTWSAASRCAGAN